MSSVGAVVVVVGVFLGLVVGVVSALSGMGWSVGWLVVSVGGGDAGGVLLELGGRSFSMFVVVLVVFLTVIGFSGCYMSGMGGLGVFEWMVVGFVVGVEILLVGSGLYSLLVGWEILGVVSFLLIGYYCSRSSWGGALFTLLVNRLGDVGVVLMFWLFLGSLLGVELGLEWVVAGVVFALTVSLTTKSAQVPFGSWLPLAMAAPTPVSALVHSSTLVIAGLYLGWFYSVYLSPVGGWLMILGVATVMGAGLGAAGEMDFKKVVAFSTSMHLGLMVVIAVVVSWWFMGVHMGFHAFFKSLLFMGVGLGIMVMVHDQDFRGSVVGGAAGVVVGLVVVSSVWSLVGLVGFSGWVTKDGFLEHELWGLQGWMVGLLVVVGLAGSSVYCLKMVMGVVGQSMGKGSVSMSWHLEEMVAVMGIMVVSVVGVVLGVGWSLWGDWGVSVGVCSGGEKLVYWLMFMFWLVLWCILGSIAGIGMVEGLESVLGGLIAGGGLSEGMWGYWMESVWVGGVVLSVVESVSGMGVNGAGGLVYLDWYFVVFVVLGGLSFVALM
uniref:NADH:ubiquinone reductase (H(+)-translocating) n=1 Tax=Centrorhynchus milvus TaxID=2594319 RepID=A0A515KYX5_9BILA|nr:NADH dehydrogenase subunit 5 [Centrorhynchus milvus]